MVTTIQRRTNQLIPCLLVFWTTANVLGLDLASFKACISSGSAATSCTLDPKPGGGAYIIGDGAFADSQTLEIQRGIPTYGWGVTLKREDSWSSGSSYYEHPLMRVASSASGASVVWFTVDGNRGANPLGLGASYAGGDLEVLANSVLISSLDMVQSPWINLVIYGSYAYVQYCNISDAQNAGVWMSGSTTGNTMWGNNFYDAGAGGIQFAGTYGAIKHNNLFRNHRGCVFGINGGQLLVYPGSNQVQIEGNLVVDGPSSCDWPQSAYWAEGIELYGSNLTLLNNTVANNGGHGIQVGGVTGASISNPDTSTYVWFNNRRNSGFSGIWVGNTSIGGNSNITINGAISVRGHAYGITFQNAASGSSATNNCVANNLVGGVYVCPGCSITVSGNVTSGCGP